MGLFLELQMLDVMAYKHRRLNGLHEHKMFEGSSGDNVNIGHGQEGRWTNLSQSQRVAQH